MNWGEYSEGSMAFGRAALYIVGIVLVYVFSFIWITQPIFSALFTKTLDTTKGSESEVIVAVFLWIAVFAFHCGAFAYGTGLIARNRGRAVKFVKEIYENEWKKSSRTD